MEQKFNCHVYKKPSLDPASKQKNVLKAFISYSRSIVILSPYIHSKVVSYFQVFQLKYCRRIPSLPCLLHALLIPSPFVSSSSKYFVVKQIIKLITPFSSASNRFLFSSTRLFSCQIMEKLNICNVMLNTQPVRIIKHTNTLY